MVIVFVQDVFGERDASSIDERQEHLLVPGGVEHHQSVWGALVTCVDAVIGAQDFVPAIPTQFEIVSASIGGYDVVAPCFPNEIGPFALLVISLPRCRCDQRKGTHSCGRFPLDHR